MRTLVMVSLLLLLLLLPPCASRPADDQCPQSDACWMPITHELMLHGSVTNRCPQRHRSLCAAQQACRASEWCGGVVQDNGISCGSKMRFELRLGRGLPDLAGVSKARNTFNTWLMLPSVPGGCAVFARKLACIRSQGGHALRRQLVALGESDWGQPAQLHLRLLGLAAASNSSFIDDGCSASLRQPPPPQTMSQAPNATFSTRLANSPVYQASRKQWLLGSVASTRCSDRGIESGGGCGGHLCFLGRCLCSRRGDPAVACIHEHSLPETAAAAQADPAAASKLAAARVSAFCRSLPVAPGAMVGARGLRAWYLHRMPSKPFVHSEAIALFNVLHRDTCEYYEGGWGTVAIDEVRWRRAQSFEVKHQEGVDSDREAQHVAMFNAYTALRSLDLGDVLEIGSGPFAQLLPLLRMAEARTHSVTLVDPLMIKYMQMPRCRYRHGRLDGHPVQLVASGGEDLDFHDAFDTVVMMNVLEHCLHGLRVLQNMHNALRVGGRLIFSERTYDELWSQMWASEHRLPFWDVGHPISLRRATTEMLLALYTPLYRVSSPTDGDYFIGVKKAQGWPSSG